MTSARTLAALLIAAWALVVSALVALPIDGDEPIGSGYTASVPDPDTRLAVTRRPAPKPLDAAEHAAVPRLWLGGR
jgi:hypothetical protein